MAHFVYLYRDKSGRPRYVGYGESSERAISHMAQTHNKALDALLNSDFKLEIAGPFGSKETALAVETALISALEPEANLAYGSREHRFRPIGVPLQFSERFELPPLSREELLSRLEPLGSPRFLCVLIQNLDFEEQDENGGVRLRRGYDPANPLGDEELLGRVRKWWQLRWKLEDWQRDRVSSPAILLAVHGRPGAQFIIASILTDRDSWHLAASSPLSPSSFEVPTLPTPGLDAEALRGRRIAREAALRFNQGGLVLFP